MYHFTYFDSSRGTNKDKKEESIYLIVHCKFMHEKYDRNNVRSSFVKFDEYADDVLSSEYSTFDSNFEIFIDHCENDEIMSIICNQLKCDNTIFDQWWSENDMDGFISQLGSKKFNRPVDENKRIALYFQLCLKVNKQEIQLIGFCQDFTNCSPDGAIDYFNKNVVKPMVRSIKHKLDEIMSEATSERGDYRYIPINVFYVYQDFSTTVDSDVNTKGDAAIGKGASIETKKLI